MTCSRESFDQTITQLDRSENRDKYEHAEQSESDPLQGESPLAAEALMILVLTNSEIQQRITSVVGLMPPHSGTQGLTLTRPLLRRLSFTATARVLCG